MLDAIKDWIHGLKEWTISLVINDGEFTENAVLALGLIAFVESSFFPIPPDIPFIMMGVTQPSISLYLALVLSIGSVLGGALGYLIGYAGGRPFVEWLVTKRFMRPIFSHEKFEMVEAYYKRYDSWAVLIAAFTPIPYKVFTIAGGLCKINFWRFMLFSFIGRSARFFIVGTILYIWGESAQVLIKRLDLFLIVMAVIGILGFVAIGFLKIRKEKESTE